MHSPKKPEMSEGALMSQDCQSMNKEGWDRSGTRAEFNSKKLEFNNIGTSSGVKNGPRCAFCHLSDREKNLEKLKK